MKFLQDFHVRDVLRGGAQALSLKVVATVAGFFVSVTLGRFYGPEGMGVYALMLTAIMTLTTISTAGLDQAVIKHLSADLATNEPGSASKTLKSAILMVFFISVSVSVIVWLGRDFISSYLLGDAIVASLLQYTALAILCIALTRICSSGLRALGFIPASHIVDGITLPVGIIVTFYLTAGAGLERAAISYLSGAILAVSIGLVFLIIGARKRSLSNVKISAHIVKKLWNMGWPSLGVVIGISVSELVSTVSLSHYATVKDIGLFRIAWQVAFLVCFLPVAMDSIMMPKIASLYALRDIKTLARLLRFNVAFIALFGVISAVMLISFSTLILSVFGDGFLEAKPYLIILVVGQIINGTLGTAGKVLIMTGHERKSLMNVLFGVCVVIISCLVLVPIYGGAGAAISIVITMAIRSCTAMFLVYKYVGINIITGKAHFNDID